MKTLLLILTSLLSLISEARELEYDNNYPIYLSDQSKYSNENLEEGFHKAFRSNKPVLLFVHGRGNEPEKSLVGGKLVEGAAVLKLEAQYGVKVIMYNWKSKAFGRDRSKPLSEMDNAADRLQIVLNRLNKFKNNFYSGRSINLLAHSMGTIVIQTLIEKYNWQHGNLFKNILISGSDTDHDKAAQWLPILGQNSQVFATINNRDGILVKSDDSRDPNAKPLGLIGPVAHISNVFFINFNFADSDNDEAFSHEIFNKDSFNFNTQVCHLFESIFAEQTNTIFQSQSIVIADDYNESDVCFQYSKVITKFSNQQNFMPSP